MVHRKPAQRVLRSLRRKLQAKPGSRGSSVDIGPARKRIKELLNPTIVTTVAADELTGDVDELINGYVADWRRALEERHLADLRRLDDLESEVAAVVAGLRVEWTDERGCLQEIEGVCAHLWDRLSEPDLPNLDPIN